MRTLENNQAWKKHSEDIIQEGLIEKGIFIKGLHAKGASNEQYKRGSYRQKSANAKTQSRVCPVTEYTRVGVWGKVWI